MASKTSARLFENGGSQCVRIPKGFRFPEEVREVVIEQDELGGLVLRPGLVLDPDLQALADLWSEDPRAAFEKAIPEGERMTPQRGMNALLRAGVLPFGPKPNGLSADGATPPPQNARWSFWMDGEGWLDAWRLLNQLRHEEYLVTALVGLGVPLDLIAKALSQISGRSAWSGLGGIGWLWAYSRGGGGAVEVGDSPWWAHFHGLDQMVEDRAAAISGFQVQARVDVGKVPVLSPLGVAARALGAEVNKGCSLVIFSPTGTGGVKLVEWLAEADSRIMTPGRMGFEGTPLAHGLGEDLQASSIFGSDLGVFLKQALAQRPQRPFVVSVQALGAMAKVEDWAMLVRGQIHDWPEALPEAWRVVGLGPGAEGPEVLWNLPHCGMDVVNELKKGE